MSASVINLVYPRQLTLSVPICLKINDLYILRPCQAVAEYLFDCSPAIPGSSTRWLLLQKEITELYEEESKSERCAGSRLLFLPKGEGGPCLWSGSVPRPNTPIDRLRRTSAFCVAAFANGMTDDRIERALEDDYLSRDPSPSTRAAYIRRTMAKARDWAVR